MGQKIDVFIHIPKTAGLTVDAILKRIYRNKKIESIRYHHLLEDLDQLRRKLENDSFDSDLIKGHYLNSIRSISEKNFRFFTFFRDPYELFRSYYSYIRNTPHNQYHRYVIKMNLFDFIDFSKKICLDNLMTRHLSQSASSFDPNLSPYVLEPFIVSKIDFENYGSKCLETAIETIALPNFIPLMVEKFDESILLLHKELNWQLMPFYVKKNVSSQKPDLTSMEKEKFIRTNQYDYDLFKKAKALFSNRLEQSGINVAEVNEFKAKNTSFAKKYQLIRLISKPLIVSKRIASRTFQMMKS